MIFKEIIMDSYDILTIPSIIGAKLSALVDTALSK